MNFTTRFALSAAILATSVSAFAQRVPGDDDVFLSCKVGSFRIQGSDKLPSQGHLEVSYTGTFLLVGLQGKLQVSGNLRKEFEDPKTQRQVYFGTGKVVIDGIFKTAEWFGRDMNAEFKGIGILSLYGEFDKDLNTGFYWYAADTKRRIGWGVGGGGQITVPAHEGMFKPTPTVRKEGGG